MGDKQEFIRFPEREQFRTRVINYLNWTNVFSLRYHLNYPLDESGLWRITGGLNLFNGRKEIDILQSSYLQVVGWAISNINFYPYYHREGDILSYRADNINADFGNITIIKPNKDVGNVILLSELGISELESKTSSSIIKISPFAGNVGPDGKEKVNRISSDGSGDIGE